MMPRRLSRACGADTYATPAPVALDVSIADLAGNAHPRLWPGLVDTGADRTVVPIEACRDLQLAPRDWGMPRGFDPASRRRRFPKYYVRIGVGGVGDVPLAAYGVERQDVLLGRDFLSALVLVIDFDRGVWQLRRPGLWTRSALRLLGLRRVR